MRQFQSLISMLLPLACLLAACQGGKAGNEEAAATATLEPLGGSGVRGTVQFTTRRPGTVRVVADVSGLSPGMHGIHVHEVGDCSAPDGKSAGEHFNPTHVSHGGPGSPAHHAGDFGNIQADDQGRATLTLETSDFTLSEGERGVLGRAVIVHAGADDLHSDPAGQSGARAACGVIRATGA